MQHELKLLLWHSEYMCFIWITAFHLQSQIPNGSHVESAIALLLYRYNVEQSLILCDIAGCWVRVIVTCFGPQKDFFLLKGFCFPPAETSSGCWWGETKHLVWISEQRQSQSLFKLKKGLFLTFRMGTSNARNKNLRPLFNTNIPPISGKYGLRNHFWSLESGFLMRKREENDFFSKSAKLPILSFWILNVHIIICQFQKRSTVIHFFSLSPCSCH